MSDPITLVWFRQDLRVKDNPALTFAAERGKVLAVYILDTSAPDEAQMGGASRWWLHQSLSSLNADLDGKLHMLSGDPQQLLPEIMQDSGADTLVWNRTYEPWQRERDSEIKSSGKDQGWQVKSFNGSLLWEPWQVLKKDETPYRVFTPYYRKGCLQKSDPRYPTGKPSSLTLYEKRDWNDGIRSLELMPDIHWYEGIKNSWMPGEEGAADNLSEFLSNAVDDYKNDRNIPSIVGTSRLSPHLHFGELSPNQIWYAAIEKYNGNTSDEDLDCYLSELGWREFSYYLLYHFPNLQHENFNDKFDHFPWRSDKKALNAWQKGQTGVPIVDAGMRELWQTGYMHNRVRMIVASFLVKNLLQDWREGERWFWDCLLDADMASNSASWQWVAGSGADAAPYFRIFNPVTQGQKFDPQGEYVTKYCPELGKLPDKFIHNPWDAPAGVLEYAGVTLGEDYPFPLVDIKASRQRALDAYAEAKEKAD